VAQIEVKSEIIRKKCLNQPSRSSKAEPDFFCCDCGWLWLGAALAGAPQIPALAFSLAMLARLGPLLAPVFDFWIPALALAVDHSEPKASPEGFLAAGAAGFAVGDVTDDRDGDAAWEDPDCV